MLDLAAFDTAAARLAAQLRQPRQPVDTSHAVWAACVAAVLEHVNAHRDGSHERRLLREVYVALLRLEPPGHTQVYEMAVEELDDELARRGLGDPAVAEWTSKELHPSPPRRRAA